MRDYIFEIVSMPACVFYRKFSLENSTRHISSSVCIHTSNKFRFQSGPSLEARYIFFGHGHCEGAEILKDSVVFLYGLGCH